MMQRRLEAEIGRVRSCYREQRIHGAFSILWVLFAGLAGALFLLGLGVTDDPGGTALILSALAAASSLLAFRGVLRGTRDPLWTVRRIEARHPELRQRLLAAVEQRPDPATGRLGFLQEAVIRQALSSSRRGAWQAPLRSKTWWLRGLHLASLLGFVSALAGMVVFGPEELISPFSVVSRSIAEASVRFEVEPGDAEVEKGASLLVLARFTDPIPSKVTLIRETVSGEVDRTNMTRSLDDPLFSGRIASIEEPGEYRVEFAGGESESFLIEVFETPRLLRADVELVFPEYTRLPSKRIEDTTRISEVEGTEVAWRFFLNKPVTRAQLIDSEGVSVGTLSREESVLEPSEGRFAYEFRSVLEEPTRFRLHLEDESGRTHRDPREFRVQVLPNRAPKFEIASPGRDSRVSPLEELDVRASVWEDFGLRRVGLSYGFAGEESREVILQEESLGRGRRELAHRIDFESLSARPDQVLTYFLWAEDLRAGGEPRRTLTDLYFAEVRPFEQVFRQANSDPASSQESPPPPGMGGGQGGIQDLALLQKQIISGTWKLICRLSSASPSEGVAEGEGIAEDVEVLQQSQAEVLGAAKERGSQLEGERDREDLEAAIESMTRALSFLNEATDGVVSSSLLDALPEEKAAFEKLMGLQPPEQNVARGAPSSGGGGGGTPSLSQAQLDQLELDRSENRYETQRTSREAEDPAARENRQVLNRLRELARRQSDLNERLKEVQTALQEAKSEAEKEEIRRELKRLRDRQREILRETDELASRMERPDNVEQMAEAQQKLTETRSNLRRASEALEEQRVSSAVASGTRAEREFKDLRDELEQEASGRFSERMQAVRDEARRLEDVERGLHEKLANLGEDRAGSLRGVRERDLVEEKLQRQKEDLRELVENMREIVEESEESEPLLSRRLYETLRGSRPERTADHLEGAREWLSRGLLEEAREEEKEAGSGLAKLREGTEKAAEGVLGGELDGLRRAEEELQSLSAELGREISRKGEELGSAEGRAKGRANGSSQGERGKPDREGDRRLAGARGESSGGDRGLLDGLFGPSDGDPNPAPLTGDSFREWSDRLRDVEEMIRIPELRDEVARIRDRAREARAEFKRHSITPNWELVTETIHRPLNQLQSRIRDELLLRQSREAQVPIDRDPVPPKFSEPVRRYYERLGRGR